MNTVKKFNDEETMARMVLQTPGQMSELIFLREQFMDLPIGSVVVKASEGGFVVADGMLVVEKKLVEELRGLLDEVQGIETECGACHELQEFAKIVKWYVEAA